MAAARFQQSRAVNLGLRRPPRGRQTQAPARTQALCSKSLVKLSPATYTIIRVQRQANSDRQNSELKCNFPILFLRFSCMWETLFWVKLFLVPKLIIE